MVWTVLKVVKKKGPPSVADLKEYYNGLKAARIAGVGMRGSLFIFVDPRYDGAFDPIPSDERNGFSTWRDERLGRDVNYYSHNNIIPAILANFARCCSTWTRPCTNCASGNGPFTECTSAVWIEDNEEGEEVTVEPLGQSCANCLFGGNPKACSFHPGVNHGYTFQRNANVWNR